VTAGLCCVQVRGAEEAAGSCCVECR
jgi:hypothetical protein